MRQNNPRVLIVGVAPGESSGSGITLKNLFFKFERKDLACIIPYIGTKLKEYSEYSSIYQLGDKERLSRLPLSQFHNKVKSGTPKKELVLQVSKKIQIQKHIKQVIYKILILIGLNHIVYAYKISPELRKWINDFSPDAIYCQLATVDMIRLAAQIKREFNIPLIIHTMDDWPNTINRPNLLYLYWHYKINHEFRYLISQSSLLMGICDAMSNEYKKRYHRKFLSFHNPIDLSSWTEFTKKNYKLNNPIRLIYFGSISSMSNQIAMSQVCKTINQMNKRGPKIEFDIYSFQDINKFSRYNGVRMHRPVKHKDLPKLVSQYDICIIPLNNNKFTNKFAKLSMPTKATECMISGVPTIVFAGKETAVFKSAQKHGWALAVEDKKRHSLKEAIEKLTSGSGIRKNISKKAVIFAKKNYDINKVSKEFKESISKIVKSNEKHCEN